MINHDKHFATVRDTAAFLASVCTCFTCPLDEREADACERGEACADNLLKWVCEVVEDEAD